MSSQLMRDNAIYNAKEAHKEMTVTDVPVTVVADFEIPAEQIKRIAGSKHGTVLRLHDVITEADAVKENIMHTLASSYFFKENQDVDFNFLLVNASVRDMWSSMTMGSLACTLAFPAMYGCSLPTDDISSCGKYRKLLDLDGPMTFLKGRRHSVVHRFGTAISEPYELISRTSLLNPKIVFPGDDFCGSECRGTGGSMPQDFVDVRKMRLHTHAVDNDNMYGTGPKPTVSEAIGPRSGYSGADYQSEFVVGLPEESYQRSWYVDNEKLNHEKGAVIKLDRYVNNMYDFMDTINQSRATNFEKCGLWFDAKLPKDELAPVYGQLEMRVIPIVPLATSGKENIPYYNLHRHVKNSLIQTKKPFEGL